MTNRALKAFSIALAVLSIVLQDSARPRPEAPGAAPSYLYRTTFLRAAPGKLLDLIALLKDRRAVDQAAGEEPPMWWRHTQGDQWDLMLLLPMGSYADYYSPPRLDRRAKAEAAAPRAPREFQAGFDAAVAWKEDLFVLGPPLEMVKNKFYDSAYFHIEIMVALPGKQSELRREREMEDAYQTAIGRPSWFIFVRDQGAPWDIFTLGCYRDLQHWAGAPDVPKETRDEAARRAGFKSADEIGPYMRTLIDMHRDTMGVAIR
jgi:hypothetical protein